MAYNTGNPVGSKDPRDLYDNATNLDNFVNGDDSFYPDRLGNQRLSLSGMGELFDAAQTGRSAEFESFLDSSGYSYVGQDYGAGIVFNRRTQYTVRNGILYSPAPSTALPYTTTGDWSAEQSKFVAYNTQDILRQDLNSPDADKGAALVRYDPTKNYPAGSIGQAFKLGAGGSESVFALLSATVSDGAMREVASYHTGWISGAAAPYGGGSFAYDSSLPKSQHNGGTIISPTVPWDGTQNGLSAFLAGTGETSPSGQGCWVRIKPANSVLEFGARGDGSTNDLSSFQKAMDSVKRVRVPARTYSLTGTLQFRFDGVCLLGESMRDTILNFTGAGPSMVNDQSASVTRLFCELRDLHVNGPAQGANTLVDWKSMQFGKIDRVWFSGQPITGGRLLNMEATWTTTECTYNEVSECYFGTMFYGVVMGDGANNNNFIGCRWQPGGVASGGGQLSNCIGALLQPTVAERLSNVNFIGCGFEYPGKIATGINVLQNCNGVFVDGCRFEQLANGVVVGGTGNRHVKVNRTDNYFSDCATNINLSAGGRATPFAPVAAGVYSGSGALTEVGNAYALTGTRSAVGVYAFTFADTMPDAGYLVEVNSNLPFNVVTNKTVTGFTLTTQNASVANTDAATLHLSVLHNR